MMRIWGVFLAALGTTALFLPELITVAAFPVGKSSGLRSAYKAIDPVQKALICIDQRTGQPCKYCDIELGSWDPSGRTGRSMTVSTGTRCAKDLYNGNPPGTDIVGRVIGMQARFGHVEQKNQSGWVYVCDTSCVSKPGFANSDSFVIDLVTRDRDGNERVWYFTYAVTLGAPGTLVAPPFIE
jgi:hypothetical protein